MALVKAAPVKPFLALFIAATAVAAQSAQRLDVHGNVNDDLTQSEALSQMEGTNTRIISLNASQLTRAHQLPSASHITQCFQSLDELLSWLCACMGCHTELSDADVDFLWEATMQGTADVRLAYFAPNTSEHLEPTVQLAMYSPQALEKLVASEISHDVFVGWVTLKLACWLARAVVKQRITYRYELTDQSLYQALSRYSISGRDVLIVGSDQPFYEAVALTYGANQVISQDSLLTSTFTAVKSMQCVAVQVVVVEYNVPPTAPHPHVTYVTPQQLSTTTRRFDVVLSISSVEHDGLGR